MTAFTTNEREDLTRQERAKLFLDKGGRCHRCTRQIRPGEVWIAEHLLALQNGGDSSPGNWDITCSNCKPKKDSEDAKTAAKARHVATRHLVPSDFRDRKGPPMLGSRASGWRKPFFGKAERR